MTDDNPFIRQGTDQLSAPVKRREMRLRIAKSDKDAPMKLSAQEKHMQEQSAQAKMWRASKKEEIKKALHGPYGEQMEILYDITRRMTIDDGDKLIDVLRALQLSGADEDTRYVALALIGASCIRVRIQNGFAPMDDSLPFSDEEPTVFEVCRAELGLP